MKIGKLVKDGGGDLKEIMLEFPITAIGRDAEQCEIVLDDKGVSRKHATFKKLPSGYMIIDHDSYNGTWVNEEKVTERALQSGDRIAVGKQRFVFFCKEVKTKRIIAKKPVVKVIGGAVEKELRRSVKDRESVS